jgi:hypothetical protein
MSTRSLLPPITEGQRREHQARIQSEIARLLVWALERAIPWVSPRA